MSFINSQLYTLLELYKAQFLPVSQWAKMSLSILSNKYFIGKYSDLGKNAEAFMTIIENLTESYKDKCFHLEEVEIAGKQVRLHQEVVVSKPFCKLLRFRKDLGMAKAKKAEPKMLVVAPISGHHSALVSGTIKGLLPHFDVYVTDWLSASMAPLSLGKFDLSDCVKYIVDFMNHLGPKVTVLAVCQPVVPVLAAAALMAEDGNKNAPEGLVLMSGPVDARINPTEVNEFALKHDIHWFKENLITQVPIGYPGFARRVYPGILQLMGFVSLNIKHHFEQYSNFFTALLEGDEAAISKHQLFYNNYLSVSDLTEEFYLQTVEEVFKKFSLPKNELHIDDRRVDLKALKTTALFCLEGSKDNITGLGQTKAALELCSNVPQGRKWYHSEEGVGHYGVFSGSRFQTNIVPKIAQFVSAINKK